VTIEPLIAVAFIAALVVAVAVGLAVNRRAAAGRLAGAVTALERLHERTDRLIRDEIARSRQESGQLSRSLREEVSRAVGQLTESTVTGVRTLAESNERRLEALRHGVEARLKELGEDNNRKLDEMRRTVDERLQGTLETKLGESFRLVSERLEQVHRGLGEMQTLASGVGDLKKVLSNVRARGLWGETQLRSLLEQVLAPEQFDANVEIRPGTGERVEYAVRLPGAEGGSEPVWLPIDAKFPLDDYERLMGAAEQGDAAAAELALRQLEARIKASGRAIRDKYVHPPGTTDFGILFLPTEGLYAEVLRREGLVGHLHRDCRVLVAGPTTLWAMLNSLQMGFRTLAIQRRAGEVWSMLSRVKADFTRFGDTLDVVGRKLEEAARRVESARQDSRRIERDLKEVESLPADASPPEEALQLNLTDTEPGAE